MIKPGVLFIAATLLTPCGPDARADQAPARAPVAHVAVCEAILNVVRPALATDTLSALRDIRHLLEVRVPPPGPVDDADAGYDVDATLARLRSPFVPDGIAQHALVVARLRAIERDLTASGTRAIVIGREFRGRDVIDRERRALSDRTRRTHENIVPYLTTMYSHGDVIKRTLKLGLMLMAAPPLALIFSGVVPPEPLWVPALALPVLGVRAAGRALARWSALSSGFDRHVERIGKALTKTKPQFLMLGGSVDVPVELFRALADQNTTLLSHERVLELAAVTENAGRMRVGTPGHLTRAQTRELHYDSIYYTDELTNEPVWLVYLRSIRPSLPEPPPPRVRQVKPAAKRPWLAGPIPQPH